MTPALEALRQDRLASATALGAVLLLGAGTAVALAGVMSGNLVQAAAGGGAAGAGLVVLLTLDLIDGLVLVAVAAALPGLDGGDGTRLTLAAPLTLAVVLAWFINRGVMRAPWVRAPIPVRAFAALGLALVIAVLFAEDVMTGLRELLNLGVLVGLLVAAVDLFRRGRAVPRVIAALLAVGAISGAAGLLEGLGVITGAFPMVRGTLQYRAAGAFGQPNALGMFLAAILPLAVFTAARGPSRAMRFAGIVASGCIALGLVATVSRGSWLAVVGGATALLLVGRVRAFVVAWIAIVFVVALLDVAGGGLFRETFLRSVDDWVIAQRVALMVAGLLMFFANPWVGVGPGGFADNVEFYGAAVPALGDVKPTPHNAYIQMGAEAGLLGLVTYVILLGTLLVVLVRSARGAARDPGVPAWERHLRLAVLWSFSTSVISAMVEWPYAHGTGQVLMLIAAMGLALAPATRS